MEYQIETSGETEILKLSGELTIQFAAKLHQVLLKVINHAKAIYIKLENVIDVDISCMQLLCSAHKTALESNKSLTLDSKSAEIFNQRLKEAGFGRTRGCSIKTETSCLWIGGGLNE